MDDTGQTYTDKKLLVKGLKQLLLALPVMVLSAYLIRLSVINKEVLPVYIFLIPGIVLVFVTIYLFFRGIKTVIKSVFG